MGFSINLKLALPIHSHLPANNTVAQSMLSSSSGQGKDASLSSARLSFLSSVNEYSEMLHKEPRACTSSLLTLGIDSLEIERSKVTTVSGIANDLDVFSGTDLSGSLKGTSSHFSLLMENLNALEDTMGDTSALTLEEDILLQLGKLGALKLFEESFDVDASRDLDLFYASDQHIEEDNTKGEKDGHVKRIVRSGKKEVRGSKRVRASEKAEGISLHSSNSQKHFIQQNASSARRASSSKKRRMMVAENEAEMSKGVKVIVNLERIKKNLEEESGQVVSLASWAKAAGLNEKELQRSLYFGWFCRDELLKSTRSFVLYIARNYRGLGIALEDLIQAGNMGVILGSERFDHTRGYRFSTYVQYWIRKSMSRVVARYGRGIRVPYTLGNAMKQIYKARKTLNYQHGKYPDDELIAKYTGLTVATVKSASQCLRVVGSIDQKVADGFSAKNMEFMPDQTMRCPEETVIRQHIRNGVWELLETLDPRERQVLLLRYGFTDHQPKSLEEIGKVFHVSKEWIRKIEKKALMKLRDQDTRSNLSYYRNLVS